MKIFHRSRQPATAVETQLDTKALPHPEMGTASQLSGGEAASPPLQAGQADADSIHTAAHDVVSQLEKSLQVLQQKATHEAAAELEKSAEILSRSAKQLQQQSDVAAEVWQKHMAGLAHESVEAVTHAATHELSQMFQEHARAARVEADAALNCIKLMGRQAVAEIETAQQGAQAGFHSRVQDQEKRLAELIATFEKSQCDSQALEGRFRDSLQTLREQAEQQMTAEFEKRFQQFVSQSGQQLQLLTETAAAAWREKLPSLIEHWQVSLDKAAAEISGKQLNLMEDRAQVARQDLDAALNAMKSTSQATLAQLQTAQQGVETSFQTCAEEYQKRMAELSSCIEALQRQSLEMKNQIQVSLQPLQQKARQQIESEFEKIVQDLVGRVGKQLERQADTTAAATWQELWAARQRIIDDAKKELGGVTRISNNPIKTSTLAGEQSIARKFRESTKAAWEGLRRLPRRTFVIAFGVVVFVIMAIVAARFFARADVQAPARPSASAAQPPAVLQAAQPLPSASAKDPMNAQGEPAVRIVSEIGSNNRQETDTPRLSEPLTKSTRLRRKLEAASAVGEFNSAPVLRRNARPSLDAPTLNVLGVSNMPQNGQLNGGLSGILTSGSRTPPPPGAQGVGKEGGPFTQPQLLSSVGVVYPSAARALRIQGEVVIQAQIDTSGRVTDMKVVSGPALLQEAAMDAVRRWRYAPARLNGKPVAAQSLITVNFKLP